MTYEEFLKFVQAKCTYETIYSDSDGRNILVIKLLDSYGMVNKAQRQWVGLTDEEIDTIYKQAEVLVNNSWVGDGTVGLMFPITLYKMFETKLKEKNTWAD
jgi:PDZ domain-containing secreted protein